MVANKQFFIERFENEQHNRPQHALDAFAFAEKLELRAFINAPNRYEKFSDPTLLNRMAYNVYHAIASNIQLEDEMIGYALYRMWCLIKAGKVLLGETKSENIEQKMQNYLQRAASLGCKEAQDELK